MFSNSFRSRSGSDAVPSTSEQKSSSNSSSEDNEEKRSSSRKWVENLSINGLFTSVVFSYK